MYGLDLFSGIGGISIALKPWVTTVAYCENDRYAQSVLLSRMSEGRIENAPIWDDVTTLKGSNLPKIDIIFGGFPCQDISVAGNGAGLEGKRSGLFFEIVRLAEETKTKFIFLENVPAIRTRGLHTIIKELSGIGFQCRWICLSAQEVGANHKRNRWFLLAAHSHRYRSRSHLSVRAENKKENLQSAGIGAIRYLEDRPDWRHQPSICRVVDGLPDWVEQIKCLGNSVVPMQAKEAFKELTGLRG